MYSNMVLLTVVTTSNPHTLYFDHPIEKPSYIRLLSASLYNSWYNLKYSDNISLAIGNGSNKHIFFQPGHYTFDSLVEMFADIKQKYPSMDITAKVNQPTGEMVIENPKSIKFGPHLVELLRVDPAVATTTITTNLQSPFNYFIHCNLMDKKQNLLNGKPSTLLAHFNIGGKPFERVHYQTSQPNVFRTIDSGDNYVNEITLAVKDENGELFNFIYRPLKFELEIN